jgi:acyloxyacyl hydrolase
LKRKKNELVGPIIIDGFEKNETPDVICHGLKICTDGGQNECRLFPSKSSSSMSIAQRGSDLRQRHPSLLPLFASKICTIPGIEEICKILENVFNNHIPLLDFDGDHFGTESSLRGSSWRGKDCDDFSQKIRPGARSVNGDVVLDQNCNGIFGLDSTTGRSWEQEFCNDTQRLGIAVLGDSISAHFHIPEQWLDARQLSVAAFEHLLFIIENELDWPQLSGTTGHVNISWPNIEGKAEFT